VAACGETSSSPSSLAWRTGAPHRRQKRAPGKVSAPQIGQDFCICFKRPDVGCRKSVKSEHL
jgi:hypothetical protein